MKNMSTKKEHRLQSEDMSVVRRHLSRLKICKYFPDISVDIFEENIVVVRRSLLQ